MAQFELYWANSNLQNRQTYHLMQPTNQQSKAAMYFFCTPRISLLVGLGSQIMSIPKERDCAASLGCCCLASAMSDQVYASANAYLSDLMVNLLVSWRYKTSIPPKVPSTSKKEDQCLWCYSVDFILPLFSFSLETVVS